MHFHGQADGAPVLFYAVPVFVLLLVLEVLFVRRHPDEDTVGFSGADTRTSLSMGVGSLVVGTPFRILELVLLTLIYDAMPWHLHGDVWWTWVVLLFAEDLCYYAYHRVSHEVRLYWSSHVVHHSSQHYNLSTALRQTWNPLTTLPFWLPLAVAGFPPWMIFTEQAVSLIYQFWIHTERVDKLPRPIELVMNTPSHHRVHHGANKIYLDRNYAGIFIIWDRIFGSFQAETEPVQYGLTKNIKTYNPLRVATHEIASIARDVRSASSWRDRVGYVLRGPGWAPSAR